MKTNSLSLDQYKLFDEAHSFFNKHLFNNELPQAVILMHRKKNSYGYFHAERFVDKQKGELRNQKKIKATEVPYFDEISLNPDDFVGRPDIAILSTLVHEMAHQWQHNCAEKKAKGRYHDKVWAKKMEEIGLMPSTTGAEGGKKTGNRVSHYIMKGEKFEKFCLQFLKGKTIKLSSYPMIGKSAEKKNKIKYSCPSCNTNVWGKPELRVTCTDCGEEFVEA